MDESGDVSDETLFARYRRGEMRAFEMLYDRYRGPLYRYLLRNSGDRAWAEDSYQDLWARVIATSRPFTEGSLRSYLFQIARNLLIDRSRRNRLHLVDDEGAVAAFPAHEPQPDERYRLADCAGRLLQEVDALPPEQREAFLLKEESGLSLEQIATLLDSGRETIKSRLRYALKRLRQALEDCL